MHRSALAVAVVTVLGLAVPSHADAPGPECVTVPLVLARTGAVRGCDTIGVLPLSSGRAFTVAVQTGQVSATVGCGGDGVNPAITQTFTVTAPFAQSAFIDRSTYCWINITALDDGTTAFAVNHSGQAFAVTGPHGI